MAALGRSCTMKRTEDTCMRMYGGKESGRRKMRRRKTRQYGVARMEYTHRGEKTLRMRVFGLSWL